ncbi:MAG: amino acid permease [Deltaproteobacteria bacterium]|nr:amino acid permease [Deltaproteobacteria bacterium]
MSVAPGRVLGLAEVIFIAVGFTIGAGVFVFTGIVAKMTGPALPLAYALAGPLVLLTMLPIAMLGSALPTTGGTYRYPCRMVSPGLAFVGIWVYVLASFFGQVPLYAISCAQYASELVPGLPIVPAALGLLTFFYLVNLLGLRVATVAQAVMVLVLLGCLLWYAGSGVAVVDPVHFDGFFQTGPGNLTLGVALLTFTYLGANGIIELGSEIRSPGRVIPRAIFITFPLVIAVYVLVAIATVGAVSWTSLVDADQPLVVAARVTMGPVGTAFFIVGGAVLGLTTTLNALFIVGTRSLLAMTEDRMLPAVLGLRSRRFGTPWVLLTAIWVLSVVGVLAGMSLETLASYATLGGMMLLFPVLMAAIVLPRRFPDAYRRSAFKLRGPWRWICTGVGFLMVFFFSLVILVDLASVARVLVFVLFVVSGLLVYLLRRTWLRRRGIDLSDLSRSGAW